MMFESVDQVIRGADVVLIGFQAKKNVDVVYSRKKLDKKKASRMLAFVESRKDAGRTDDPPVPKDYGTGRSLHCCGTSHPAELIPFLD